MDVRLRPLGCVGQLGAVLSLGLLPLLKRSQEAQFPASFTDDAMILRNGTRIPWTAFTRIKATDVYLNRAYQHTLYELWHPGGRLHFPTHRIDDADSVVKFILGHLPPGVARPTSS